jgi:hypothetical protein
MTYCGGDRSRAFVFLREIGDTDEVDSFDDITATIFHNTAEIFMQGTSQALKSRETLHIRSTSGKIVWHHLNDWDLQVQLNLAIKREGARG